MTSFPQTKGSVASTVVALSQVVAELEDARSELELTKNTLDRREVELVEQRKQTRELTEEMQHLLYTLSHDLRSPLVTIQGFSSLISTALEQNDVDDARDSAARILRATKKMADRIQGVLTLSRAGSAPEQEEWVEVDDLVAEVMGSFETQCACAGARIVTKIQVPRIWTTRSRVRQVLENLIGNALNYGCEEQGACIEVGCIDAPRHHHFYVKDFGPGIDAADHQKVFLIFHRLNTTREGSGLGLALVLKIARSLGGQAWVESKRGDGATFWFSVPKATAVETPKTTHKFLPAGE